MASGNPRSFFRISRPEVDLPPDVDEHSGAVHAKGRQALDEFRRNGWLLLDDGPRFSLYRQRMARGRKDIPKILRYTTHAENNSLYNTPPTFAVYLMRNVLAWIDAQGGLVAMERRNNEKAQILYGALDRMSDFYRAPVEEAARSTMNVVFRLPTEELDDRFVAEAKKQRMVGLKGHRSAGGIRVSAYNAVSPENIRTLVSFMESFAKANG